VGKQVSGAALNAHSGVIFPFSEGVKMASSTSRHDRLDISAIPLLYTLIARAALANYLGSTDPVPRELAHVNLADTVDPEEWVQHALGIAPLASETRHEAVVLEDVGAGTSSSRFSTRCPSGLLCPVREDADDAD
jgi:hypothetical protein